MGSNPTWPNQSEPKVSRGRTVNPVISGCEPRQAVWILNMRKLILQCLGIVSLAVLTIWLLQKGELLSAVALMGLSALFLLLGNGRANI